MKRKIFATTIVSVLFAFCSPSLTFADAAKPPAPAYSIQSTVGELLANEKTKAVVKKYIPDLIDSPNMAMIESMSLQDLSGFPQANLDEEKLKAIQADLAKIK